MNPYPQQQQPPSMSVAMSPRPGSMVGPPPPQIPGQQPQHAGAPGIGMVRGQSNTAPQMSALSSLSTNPPTLGHPINLFSSQQTLPDMDPDVHVHHNDIQLNSYIYDHLLKNGFYNAARGLLGETSLLLVQGHRAEESSEQDGDGNSLVPRRTTNLKRSQSGMDHPNSSPRDKPNGKSPGSGANSPRAQNSDLPPANVPLTSTGGFLREWWSVFWDVYAARSAIPSSSAFASAYLDTQRTQRGQFNPAMQRNQQLMNGVGDDANMDKKSLMHTAIVNNGRKVNNRPGQPMQMPAQPNAPQVMAMKHQQQQQQAAAQQQQPQQQNQQAQPQRQGEGEASGASPAIGQANSPNKRPRLSPPHEQFQLPNQGPNPAQQPNGLTQQMQQLLTSLQNPQNALVFLQRNGVTIPQQYSQTEITNLARSYAMNPNARISHINTYRHNLALQQQQQGLTMARNPGASPAAQAGSIPLLNPGMSPTVSFLARNPDANINRQPTQAELRDLESEAEQMGGRLIHPPAGGSHSLLDYQNQLMVLEHQNKKRLQHARHETTGIRSDDPNFPGPGPGPQQGLQPGHAQAQGVSMSPSTSHTGPSPRIPNTELGQQQPQQQPHPQQRKPGQKNGSGGASPETGDPVQIRNPNQAFPPQGGMTPDQFQQMAQMGAYAPNMIVTQNGQAQFIPQGQGRPPQIPFNQQQQGPMMEMLKRGMPAQPGQPYPAGWPQQMMSQQMNPQMRQQQPGLMHGHQGPPAQNPQGPMAPPPQPPPQGARPQAPSESPSLASAQPPTPTPGNKTIPPKGKAQKEGGRAKRAARKSAAAPATPNASEPPTPTTPITPHAPVPFNQANQQVNPSQPPQQAPPQPAQPEQPTPQPAPSQDQAPTAFGAIDHAAEAAGDNWSSTVDEKNWMSNLPMDFTANNFMRSLEDFDNQNFNPTMGEEEMVNYSDFLNEQDGFAVESFGNMWGDDLTGPGTEV